jgi:hypothetical protein
MPSFGMSAAYARGKSVRKQLRAMHITMPEGGGAGGPIKVEHEHAAPHAPARYQFGPEQHEELAAHVMQHLGLKLPGKATGEEDSAEPEVSKSNFSGPANGHR